MPTVTVSWKDAEGVKKSKILNENDSTDLLNIDRRQLCGYLKGKRIKSAFVIHFLSMEVSRNYLAFTVAGNSVIVTVHRNSSLKLLIVDPVPIPLPRSIEVRLTARKSNCWVHLFALKDSKFVKSISGCWFEMPILIQDEMEVDTSQYRFRYLIKKGLLSKPLTLAEIFSSANLPKISSKSLILFIHQADEYVFTFKNRFFTTEGLPSICRAAIRDVLERDPHLERSLMRRIVVGALNGGLVLDLLSLIGWDASQFKQLNINFPNSDSIDLDTAKALFQVPIETYHENKELFRTEAGFCSGFWLPCLFAGVLGSGQRVDLEWPTTTADPNADLGFVDAAVLTQISDNLAVPILMIEAGREGAPAGTFHKDHGKMIGLLTWNCQRIAQELRSQGKDPSRAVSFGWLIGGNDLQVYTACAQVCPPEEDHDIIVNIKSQPHGTINLLTGLLRENGCVASCCGTVEAGCFASFNEPTETQFQSFIQSLTQETQPTEATQPNQLPGNAVLSLESANTLHLLPNPTEGDHCVHDSAVRTIYFLLKGALEYSAFIRDAPELPPPAPPSQNRSSLLPSATDGTNQETPNGSKVSTASRGRKSRKDITIKVKKKWCPFELHLYQNLSKEYPVSFPCCLEPVIDEVDGTIECHFEWMHSLLEKGKYGEDVLNSKIFRKDSPVSLLNDAFEALLGTSVCLEVLHSDYHVLHCNISPKSVMYSWLGRCFKLTDFKHAVPIDDALKKPRIAGFRGLTAPEAEKSGIFTPACDIYALGKTLSHVFDFEFKRFTFDQPEYLSLHSLWQKLIEMMTHSEPGKRPLASTCIQIALFATMECFKSSGIHLIIKEAMSVLEDSDCPYGIECIDDCWSLLSGPDDSMEIETIAIPGETDEKEKL